MTFTINNGRRADVEFGSYHGRAGISANGTEVAFLAALRDFRDPLGGALKVTSGEIDGNPFTVIDARRSESVDGMIVLTVAAVINGATD